MQRAGTGLLDGPTWPATGQEKILADLGVAVDVHHTEAHRPVSGRGGLPGPTALITVDFGGVRG